eukprot:TRINITY_DN968_c0_g1_i2.p3 TRINITY_DN968_c0_g1~~TRINITY_DN968_c0_g1_i2.p3  ORF type:complete len:178 (-),score=34.03 TRINITY_DN968_c0_g1_i2:317-850(-)
MRWEVLEIVGRVDAVVSEQVGDSAGERLLELLVLDGGGDVPRVPLPAGVHIERGGDEDELDGRPTEFAVVVRDGGVVGYRFGDDEDLEGEGVERLRPPASPRDDMEAYVDAEFTGREGGRAPQGIIAGDAPHRRLRRALHGHNSADRELFHRDPAFAVERDRDAVRQEDVAFEGASE